MVTHIYGNGGEQNEERRT